jgi:hypothetical protein
MPAADRRLCPLVRPPLPQRRKTSATPAHCRAWRSRCFRAVRHRGRVRAAFGQRPFPWPIRNGSPHPAGKGQARFSLTKGEGVLKRLPTLGSVTRTGTLQEMAFCSIKQGLSSTTKAFFLWRIGGRSSNVQGDAALRRGAARHEGESPLSRSWVNFHEGQLNLMRTPSSTAIGRGVRPHVNPTHSHPPRPGPPIPGI